MEASEILVALLSAIFGGAGLEGIRHVLQKKKSTDDTATVLRDELRKDLAAVRAELRKTEEELDVTREKHFTITEELWKTKSQLAEVMEELRKMKKGSE